jgi:hypothetical protein
MQIHVNKDGQQYGPFTLEQLQQYVQQGNFTPQDHAFFEGCQEWVTIAQVPGFAGEAQAAAQPQAQQVAQQPAQAQAAAQAQAQAAAQQQQAAAGVVVDVAAKKKKIILWSSIGVAAALVVAGVLFMVLSGDEEEESDKVAETPEEKSGGVASRSTLLLDRIPADALAVTSFDVGGILEKGGSKAVSMLPDEIPPILKKVFNDPSSIGLDITEPVRVYFMEHPTKPDEDPTTGIVVKLSDSTKLKQFAQSMNAPDPIESKDGYDLYEIDGGKGYLALASEFLCLISNDDRRAGAQHLTKELERFMTSDGSNSFVKAHPGLAMQASKGYDLSVWVDLEKIGSLAEGEAPDALLGLFESGVLTGGLRFDDGELVLELDGASKGLSKTLGGGGLPAKMTKFLSSEAPLVASVSMSLDGMIGLFNDTLADETGMDLEEPIEQFGISPREVLDVFQGDFAFSLLKLDDLFGEEAMEDDSPAIKSEGPGNFGDEGETGPPPNPFADTPSPNPFGGEPSPVPEIAVDPVPGAGNPFGGPSAPGGPQIAIEPPPPPPFEGGPPPGGPSGGMAMNLPDFVLAASIDDAKWSAIMTKSPALAGILAMAPLMGVALKAENGVLAVGLAQTQASVVADQGFAKPVSGSSQTLFTSNDVVIKISIDNVVQSLGDLPPQFSAILKRFDSLAITAKTRSDGGSLSLRLGFTDKRTNSLPALMDLFTLAGSLIGEFLGGLQEDVPEGHGHGHDERKTEDHQRF